MRLYNNPEKEERECSKCHQIKHYIEFKNRSDYPHIKRSICKTCNIKMEVYRLQIKSWINKIHAFRFVTNGLIKCKFCNDGGIENLPIFDFHHPSTELSTELAREEGFWRSIRYKSWAKIKNELINQRVIAICRNCHATIGASFFNNYVVIINHLNDPKLVTPNITPVKYVRNELKTYIRKKKIFLELWDGRCYNCGFGITEDNIENLPALETHHLDPKRKSFHNFHKLCFLNSDIDKLKKILLEDNCICLCSNCHILEQSTFFIENKKEIFRRYKQKFC
ncbi:MAG: hypothetical protein ACFFCV_08475 [Promethearchaeota archaeon]